jgi:hypothetical protein
MLSLLYPPAQRRKLEHMYQDAFKYHMSISSIAARYRDRATDFTRSDNPDALLGQPAGICARSELPSKLTCSKGKWLQQALDLLMVQRQITAAYELWRANHAAAQQEPR